jgi:hypothetical protein
MNNLMNIEGYAAKYILTKGLKTVSRAYLARPFERGTKRRLCIYYAPNRISFSQIYPFIYYQKELSDRFNLQIRAIPVDALLSGVKPKNTMADIVLLQTWFTVESSALVRALDQIKDTNPGAEISFLDSFAHNDLRLAKHLDPYIRFYLKKSLFKKKADYLRPYKGDTNLTEFYGDLFNISQTPVDWGIPESILGKLKLSPNFFTSEHFLKSFRNKHSAACQPRSNDIHARLACHGSDWYNAMRTSALEQVKQSGLKALTETGVSWHQYMSELRNSKLCFSPFGYGELCWRDIEAIQTGSVLIKPDMGHLETLPNIYIPNKTYLPIRWDFNDFTEKAQIVLDDQALSDEMAHNAYNGIQAYIQKSQFVEDMSYLFESG